MHPNSLIRRTHSAQFKAQVLAACRQPGASVSAVALANNLNVNVVRKWLAGRGMKRCSSATVQHGLVAMWLTSHSPIARMFGLRHHCAHVRQLRTQH